MQTLNLWVDGARVAFNLGVDHVNKTKDHSKKGFGKVQECGLGRRDQRKVMRRKKR